MSEYFPEPKSSGGKVKVELDLYNYETKADFKNATGAETTLNVKINDIKGELPSITNLATTATLTAVENKIPNISNLVKKTDYNPKINEIEKKIMIMINILLLQNSIS